MDDIKSFLAYFYRAICEFSSTKYPATNLYFPMVSLIYVTLKQQIQCEDEYKRLMATQISQILEILIIIQRSVSHSNYLGSSFPALS